jgi:hypothetical protein
LRFLTVLPSFVFLYDFICEFLCITVDFPTHPR